MSNLTNPSQLSRYWLLIGVTALAIAGLFSLVLVAARAPDAPGAALFTDWFHQALVAHVDLSTLVWFLSITCLLWSLQTANTPSFMPMIEESALACFALATALITLSPFGHGLALMSNYIPVLHSPLFFLGLALLVCGVLLMMVRLLSPAGREASAQDPVPRPWLAQDLRFALISSAVIVAVALAAFVRAFLTMPSVIQDTQYYDMLFWGGGHILQFAYVQVAMVCWLLLTKALYPSFYIHPKHLYVVIAFGPVCALFGIFIYTAYPVESAQYRTLFTDLMILCNGVAPTILALWILPGLLQLRMWRGPHRTLWSALLMSLLLFIYGNILGALIEGQNVVIPAHYHGSIVGVTLAFMGIAYLLLPQFGWRDVSNSRLAYWQPIVYGVGQFMHVSGLAWSGGYGVLRKTPGGLADMPTSVKAAMGFMGLGGMLAIIGGFMFVVVIFRAVRKTSEA